MGTRTTIIIRRKDIINIFGCSAVTASKRLKAIRDRFNKVKGDPVTIQELSDMYKIRIEEIEKVIDKFGVV